MTLEEIAQMHLEHVMKRLFNKYNATHEEQLREYLCQDTVKCNMAET